MSLRWAPYLLLLLLVGGAPSADAEIPVPAGEALVIDIEGAIGPATSTFVERSIARAAGSGARVLILRMDTPGGLDTSMRAIVKAILASPVAVVGYVAPSGARAASAGTYILYACHIAAMAPGTNLGAATPVQIGGLPGIEPEPKQPKEGEAGKEEQPKEKTTGDASKDKLINDAAAYLRSLAQLRGRNAEWAEQAVRGAASLPAEEALQLGVVDLVVPNLEALLTAIDGRLVRTAAGEMRLATAGATLTVLTPDWRTRILAIIANPNVAYVLMLIGIYGLIYEFSNPGTVLPGTVGAVSLVLALYAFQLLPVNYAGVALILLGLALMIAEAFMPSFGALGIGGIAAFVVGSLILVDTEVPGFGLSVPLVLSFALTSGVLLVVVIGMAIRSRRRAVVSGSEQLMGAVATALGGFPDDGSVHLRGETWTARSTAPIAPGQAVEVIGREGLTLIVSPLPLSKEI
jgi:membrane-bound serine protease (ClpP class)